MSDPPKDRVEYWIRFVCAFLFFGFIMALVILRCVDGWGLKTGIAVWAIVTTGISMYAARQGDDAWRTILRFFGGW